MGRPRKIVAGASAGNIGEAGALDVSAPDNFVVGQKFEFSVPTLTVNPIDQLRAGGIPVIKAEFHAAVNNAKDIPENGFNDASLNASRRADMWWTKAGLLCFQSGKYFLVPEATVKFCHFK